MPKGNGGNKEAFLNVALFATHEAFPDIDLPVFPVILCGPNQIKE